MHFLPKTQFCTYIPVLTPRTLEDAEGVVIPSRIGDTA